MSDKTRCPICFGKGQWWAFSDRHWQKWGFVKGPDHLQSCGFCNGIGTVLASRLLIDDKETTNGG